jgi:hypothetical protein
MLIQRLGRLAGWGRSRQLNARPTHLRDARSSHPLNDSIVLIGHFRNAWLDRRRRWRSMECVRLGSR